MDRSSAQSAFDALSDPTRRRILQVLSDNEERSAGAIADAIHEVGRTSVSSHLRILRSADLIVERKEGRYRYYSLHPQGAVQDALNFLQSILFQGVARGDSVGVGAGTKDALSGEPMTSTRSAARERHAS
ncbi:metalloregulator ArsR/SmtB family transcription factor [Paenarthrobacter nitroguajacolicus]|uniref:metalloregulator ArsR/SmtB family transcription factor n=1 Tax=Paenarthrobacter nitroguajacolicus TaxID=211146 RepID=UPI00248B32C4|nr:metalloregulator ArsR/SmtB family transcription factor [Paenarthrobacter nitroguajacolicus]MDI2037254.1 hypothetical protein [Paenarthrobacter nitroguajacolicus]